MYQQQEYDMKFYRMTRDERMHQVLKHLHSAGSLTFGGIAHVCGLKKSPYLRGVVNELIDLGLARVSEHNTGGILPVYIYHPVDVTGAAE